MEPADLFQRLAAPFPETDLEWRVGSSGSGRNGPWARVLAYLTNRAIQDRLDAVIGPQNWRNRFDTVGGGILCGLSLRIDGEWIEKIDGAEPTDIEAFKGGLSNAMKRAAVQWGIGRFLYGITDCWAVIDANGSHYGKLKDGTEFRWNPPKLNLSPAPVAPAPVLVNQPCVSTVVKAPAPAKPVEEQRQSVNVPPANDGPSKDDTDQLYFQLIGKNGAMHQNYLPLVKALYTSAPSLQDRWNTLTALLRSVHDTIKVMGKESACDTLEEITLGLPIDRKSPSALDAEEWMHAIVTLAETGAVPSGRK